MLVVAKDGTGDYTQIQDAVDAAKRRGGPDQTVLIKRGVYRERVVVHCDGLRLVGEDAQETVITWSACARDRDELGCEKGTFLSFSVLVAGNDVTVENLTIRNDAGDGRKVGQAVALYAAGDRGAYLRCRLIAHQDTLFCGPLMPKVQAEIRPRLSSAECVESVGDCPPTRGRQYFEGCHIRGAIDFIFGPYRCWFEGCEFFMNERGGYYTAANTPEGQDHGFIFHDCLLTGACSPGAATLGRTWRPYARTVFLDCTMDECVSPTGFSDWDEKRVVTERLGEYGTRGRKADQAQRHPAQKRLTVREAEALTVHHVLGGTDGWQPKRHIETWFLCGDSTMADYPADRAPMAGWGQALPTLLTPRVTVENRAINGRSSKSFVEEGRLEEIECLLRAGDKLIIGFGHNDEKIADPARYTTPEGTYPQYLNMFIDAALKRGAEPVLVTPTVRRRFDSEGRLIPTHGA
ncbi:MAG: hypothetical protein IJ240_00085, partial [Clostridia bacterium]|nr:hypothetical protein [Clostridia bacterium]